MANVASPFGLLLREHPTGQSRARAYKIATGYAANIGYGDLVKLTTDGVLNAAAATEDGIGVFAGVQYTDATGKPTFSKNWITGTAATDITAWVYDDPNNIYEVQVGATGTAYVQTIIGAQADIVVGTPNSATGQSTSYLNATPEAAAAQGQFRVIGFGASGMYDATTNAFPTVLVQLAQHQFVANKVAL